MKYFKIFLLLFFTQLLVSCTSVGNKSNPTLTQKAKKKLVMVKSINLSEEKNIEVTEEKNIEVTESNSIDLSETESAVDENQTFLIEENLKLRQRLYEQDVEIIALEKKKNIFSSKKSSKNTTLFLQKNSPAKKNTISSTKTSSQKKPTPFKISSKSKKNSNGNLKKNRSKIIKNKKNLVKITPNKKDLPKITQSKKNIVLKKKHKTFSAKAHLKNTAEAFIKKPLPKSRKNVFSKNIIPKNPKNSSIKSSKKKSVLQKIAKVEMDKKKSALEIKRKNTTLKVTTENKKREKVSTIYGNPNKSANIENIAGTLNIDPRHNVRIIALPESRKASANNIISFLEKIDLKATQYLLGSYWVVDIINVPKFRTKESEIFIKKIQNLKYQGRVDFFDAHYVRKQYPADLNNS